MSFNNTTIFMVGCGKMGGALLGGWIKAGLSPEAVKVRVATEESAVKLRTEYGVQANLDAAPTDEAIILYAVKPQILPQILAMKWPENALHISIAAGVKTNSFQKALGEKARVIRAMPNTPALVGQGVTSLYAGVNASEEDKQLAVSLFSVSGDALWVKTENLLDAATALAGSGPAYVYHFVEALIAAGENIGLDEQTARQMAIGTIKGSVALAEAEGWNVTELRENVTSKGGVTAAALSIIMPELTALFGRALHANLQRAKELAQENA